MCGIAGVFNFNGEPAEPALLDRMIGRLRHRGPDECHTYANRQIGLAHARLSIIDLAFGQQPMHNDDGSLSIVFNGEIFNHVELREEMLRKGTRFRTRSDTEVILRLYEEMGEECVHQLNGQWAFAIRDARKQQLFLSRDRLGVRPLYYTVANGAFLFASEVKAIFACPQVSREIDPIALDQIFTFWVSLPPRTIFRDIQELPPGHSLTVRPNEVTRQRYWQLDYPEESEGIEASIWDEGRYAEELFDLLLDATRIRLRSDVPVGAYLSGGLDSTLVTALVRKLVSAPLKTFSVTFDDPEFDESRYQEDAVRLLGTEHEEVRCTREEIGEVFPSVVWHTEQPILRTAPAPLFILSGLVREHGYKVVLTGEGSDEMLGGYDIFKEAKIRRFWSAHPDSRLRPLLLRRLYPYLPNLHRQSDAYLKSFFHVRPEDVRSNFFSHLPRWEMTAKLKAFFSDDVKAAIGDYDGYKECRRLLPAGFPRWSGFCQAQYFEAQYLLPGYILSSQGDRVAMAHSVEGRFPFLDYRVVEFASRIPPRLKMKVLDEKYLLKRCAQDWVPASVRTRHKQPYRAPEGKSFLGGSPPVYVEDLLSPERIGKDGIFHPLAVQKLLDKFRQDRAIGIRDNLALVGILSTQLVVDQFIHHSGEHATYANHRAGTPLLCHR
jgi:asparagine synthase (glutamine-hydrolysing)